MHAEANAIISAARSECLGGALYLVSRDAVTGELLERQEPCSVCCRMIINAGLSKVVVVRQPVPGVRVQDWVFKMIPSWSRARGIDINIEGAPPGCSPDGGAPLSMKKRPTGTGRFLSVLQKRER